MLETTFIVYIVRPYSTYSRAEIVSAAKVYGFDTGFVCHCRGWTNLRNEDLGLLWEHIVLNELIGRNCSSSINYWRDKRGHELDFVLNTRGSAPIAIECKWSSDKFDPKNLKIFRGRYPEGENYVVANDVDYEYKRDFDGITVSFVSLPMLINALCA